MAEELGTKDVLEIVHTRLGTLEQDVRALDSKFDARFDRVLAKVDERFENVREEIGGLRSDMDVTTRWIIGVIFASWLSMMASIWLML